MRKLLLPAGLLAAGTLAALPFRKAGNDGASDPAAAPQQALSALTDEPGDQIEDRSPAELVQQYQRRETRRVDPYEISVPVLPDSYHEVAVPLLVDSQAENLLQRHSAAKPPTGHTRYGIPLEAYADRAENKDEGTTALATSWSAARPLESLQATPDQFPAKPGRGDSEPGRGDSNSSGASNVDHLAGNEQTAPRASFQTTAAAVKNDRKSAVSPQPAELPEPRRRQFIREPE